MTKEEPEPRLVQVRWLDSMAYDRWDSRSSIKDKLTESDGGLEHITVGWLIDDTETHIIIASSRHSTEDVWNGAMAIPRAVVLDTKDVT